MEKQDTIGLLQECDAGTKMAVSSIDEMLEYADDPKLKKVLQKSKEHHEKLGNEIHAMLNEKGVPEKDPSVMAQSMSWMKTSWKLGIDGSDATIADLVTDGCNMGIKNLRRYKNQYEDADKSIKQLCEELISMEHHLCKEMRDYL